MKYILFMNYLTYNDSLEINFDYRQEESTPLN